MSVSKWNYSERCDGMPCIGDCDECKVWQDFCEEEEEDRVEANIYNYAPLVYLTADSARIAKDCQYPYCESCSDYVASHGKMYCRVPMVVSKQIWCIMEGLIKKLTERVDEIENLVTDEILGLRGDAEE